MDEINSNFLFSKFFFFNHSMFYIMDKTNKIKINLTNATHWFENYVNFLFYCKMILDGIVLEEAMIKHNEIK